MRLGIMPFLHEPGQQALGRFGVAAVPNDLVEYVPALIDGAPEPVFPASNADDCLVQVPNVAWAWRLAAKTSGILRTELPAPSADRFVGYDDAALEQHHLDEPEAQGKSEVQPNCIGIIWGANRWRL
jgi:hypothetical protein